MPVIAAVPAAAGVLAGGAAKGGMLAGLLKTLGLGGKLAGKAAATKGLKAAAWGVNPNMIGANTGSRMATQALGEAAQKGIFGKLGSSTFGKNFVSMMPKSAGEWGMRVAPDAIFGVMAGAMTPGDFGDKMIAGTTATLGGAAGGLAGRGLIGGISPKLMSNPMIDISTEMIGGLSGDIAAQGIADGILRAKGGGMTPYEKMAANQQRQLEEDILRRYLSGKGGYPSQDQFLAQNGLG